MLPLLTTRSEPIFHSATQFLVAWFAENYPGINKEQLTDGWMPWCDWWSAI